jgi:ketosteroid isomerase-like protein
VLERRSCSRFPGVSRCAVSFFVLMGLFGAEADSNEAAPALTEVSRSSARAASREIAEIAQLREDWVRDLALKRLEPILKLYAENAVFLPPSGERMTGQAALRELFRTVMAAFKSDLVFHSLNSEVSGELAYDSGEWQETLTSVSTGVKRDLCGNYLMVLKRQPAGGWLLAEQVWTMAPAPQTEATK